MLLHELMTIFKRKRLPNQVVVMCDVIVLIEDLVCGRLLQDVTRYMFEVLLHRKPQVVLQDLHPSYNCHFIERFRQRLASVRRTQVEPSELLLGRCLCIIDKTDKREQKGDCVHLVS